MDLSRFAGLIGALENASRVLLEDKNTTFMFGFHLRGEGSDISVLVNEVKLKNILGIYERLGGNSLRRVLIYFFSQNWAIPLLETSPLPEGLSVNVGGHTVNFASVNGIEDWSESGGKWITYRANILTD